MSELKENQVKAEQYLQRFKDAPTGHFINGEMIIPEDAEAFDNFSPIDNSNLGQVVATQGAACAQRTRAVCRRVERCLVTLNQYYELNQMGFESVSQEQLVGANKYVNRLSDLLFTIGRLLNKRAGLDEIMWSSHRTN